MAENFFCINKGVMTYKYEFSSNGKRYIVRCYPQGREFLASLEFKYLKRFKALDIKVPCPDYFMEMPNLAFLIYEKLEGNDLSLIFNRLSHEQQLQVCDEIILNYKKISSIQTLGNGYIEKNNKFSYYSWRDFLHKELCKSFEYISTLETDFNKNKLKLYMFNFLSLHIKDIKNLVWSDFSLDNIIVNKENHLAGFIDFEGLMGGDPLLGLGYLQAQSYNTSFYQMIHAKYLPHKSKDIVDFYSIFRYLKLITYSKMNLPNGSVRDPIDFFLQKAHSLIKEKSF